MEYYFAPMEGITTAIYRRVHADLFGGADRYYSPFISPTAEHLFTPRELRELGPENNRGIPLVPQVLTKNADDFLWAAAGLADMGYGEVNLNLGCPSATVTAKGKGSALLIKALCGQGTIDGAVSMGGGQGTLLAAMVMKELPIGFPKLILSTIANLRTPPFDGVRDTVVLNSLVDVSGLNHVLKMSIRTAAAAMAGMVLGREKEEQETPRKTVGITMFGVHALRGACAADP